MSKLVHITTMLAGFFCLCVLFFTISIYEVEKPVIVEKVEENPQIDIVFSPKVEEKPQKEEEITFLFEEEIDTSEFTCLMYATEDLGTYYITAYSDKETGGKTTASGKKVHKGTISTCAADVPKYHKFGDYLEIDGKLYVVEDTGSAVKKKHIDCYEPDMKKLDNYTGYKKVYKVTFPFGKPKDL